MDNKLQQKFALVQQMKKEKERKEASRGKDHRSVDIFALAGVNLPATGLAHSRQDKDKNQNSRHGSSVKGLRVQSTISPTAASTGGPLSPSSCINFVGSPGRESEEVSANEIGTTISATLGTGAGTEKKLKRSSMASRNATAASRMHVHRDTASSSEKMV
ncbi:hypothetical protein EC991_005612 [Linnemannia zychae]|nr:hypothetical protein EC991_005612 [Linnemannia zychae]